MKKFKQKQAECKELEKQKHTLEATQMLESSAGRGIGVTANPKMEVRPVTVSTHFMGRTDCHQFEVDEALFIAQSIIELVGGE